MSKFCRVIRKNGRIYTSKLIDEVMRMCGRMSSDCFYFLKGIKGKVIAEVSMG